MTDTDLTAVLAAIRERSEHHIDPSFRGLGITNPDVHALLMSGGDVPPLLAAVEKALELATAWEEDAAGLADLAERAAARGALPERTDALAASADSLQDCARRLREAISAALLGEGKP